MADATPPPPAAAPADEADPLVNFDSFFICRDYETKTYSFDVRRRRGEDARVPPPLPADGGDTTTAATTAADDDNGDDYTATVAQNIEALAAASTDFDLTGQIVWLVSVVTAHYVAAEGWRDLAGRPALELGAGAGLVGLTASRWASHLALTDNEDEVLTLMRSNLVHVPPHCEGSVHGLSWGDDSDHARLAAAAGRATWPVLLGADIVYWSAAIAPLMESVARLLERPPPKVGGGGSDSAAAEAPPASPFQPVFILGYFNRVDSMRVRLLEEAARQGLVWTEVGWDWLPQPPPPAYANGLKNMTIFRFTWPMAAAGAATPADGGGDVR
jgi:hypothetical protein